MLFRSMVNPGAGAPPGNVVSVIAALFERSGGVNASSPLLSTLSAHGGYGTFIETWSMICGLEEKKRRSNDPVIKATIILCFLANIWENETNKNATRRELRCQGVEEHA